MYTLQQLNAVSQGALNGQSINKLGTAASNLPRRDLKQLGNDLDQLVKTPKIKVDSGNRVSVRDRAIRKIMPKAMHLVGSRKNKAMMLERLLDMIEKAGKMGKDKAENLIAQLWVVYAHIEANHIDDDHWIVTDIPQGRTMQRLTDIYYIKNGKAYRYDDTRELVSQVASKVWSGEECNSTKGNHFYKVKGASGDSLGDYWKLPEGMTLPKGTK